MSLKSKTINSKAKLLLVDDHQIVLDGMSLMLSKLNNIEIVKTTVDANEVLRYLAEYEVDLVITDISMPKMDGITLTKLIKSEYSDVKVMILSMHLEESIVNDAILAEAEGYLLKDANMEEVHMAVQKVLDNATYYSDAVVQLILQGIKIEKKQSKHLELLTPRELEILQLICDEKTTAQIAEILFISSMTVDTHRKNILRKTQAKSIVGLIKFAILNQLVTVN